MKIQFSLPTATQEEVYAATEFIDFGDGVKKEVVVIYPKNKLIPRHLANAAIAKLNKHLNN